MTTTTWRQRKGSDTWHFVRACSNWPPISHAKERKTKPRDGELCDQCISKAFAAHAKRPPPAEIAKLSWWKRGWNWFFQVPDNGD